MKAGKDFAVWARHLGKFLIRNRSGIPWDRGMVLPLGYARQTDLPVHAFEARRYLVGFLGSIENSRYASLSLRSLVGTPKGIARGHMAASLGVLAAKYGDRVFLQTTGSYNESIMTDPEFYSQTLAQTQIALAPRGSSPETYRLFEAMRQGCVGICDRLPKHPFYVGCRPSSSTIGERWIVRSRSFAQMGGFRSGIVRRWPGGMSDFPRGP